MGQSSTLGASSRFVNDQDLDFLAGRKTDEDIIFKEVYDIRKVDSRMYSQPTEILNSILSSRELLTCLYPDIDIRNAHKQFADRLDRCLVVSLASTLTGNASVLETGTYSGFTTSCAALGLAKSHSKGLVFTVDLPTSERVTQEHHISSFEIDKLVPIHLKRRVVQHIEDAESAIPRILQDEHIELFIHDSLHTITHMMYEYVVARALMPPLSILVSDDILWNCSFVKYVQLFECPFWVCKTNPNYGIAVNTIHPQEQGMIWGRQRLTDYMMNQEG